MDEKSEKKSSVFPEFKNLAQATRFVRENIDPRARFGDHYNRVSFGIQYGDSGMLILGLGGTFQEALDKAYESKSIEYPKAKAKKATRKVSRKMLARSILDTSRESLGEGKVTALDIARSMMDDYA